jgi:hypothetical protein
MGWVLVFLCAVLVLGAPTPGAYAQDEGPWIAVDFSTGPRSVLYSVETAGVAPEEASDGPTESEIEVPMVDAVFVHGGSGG